MSLNYKIIELKLDNITSKDSNIKIPQFQRGLVWNLSKQKEFIKTMREGDPFGSILLSQDSRTGDFNLIDGLQRISTIKKFMNNPEEFIDGDWIPKDLFNKVVSIFSTTRTLPSAGKEAFLEKLKKNILETYYKNMNNVMKMATDLIETYNFPSDRHKNVFEVIGEIHDSITKQIKLNSAIIPAIIYTGDKSKLPTVFARMNQGAVTLSKYEVLASAWFSYEIDINDDEISKYIKQKYIKLRDESDLEVNFNIDDLDNKINVFEYCYSIGDLLKDNKRDFYIIFGEKSKSMSTDSLGFDIIALLLGNKVNEVEGIKDFLYNAPKANDKFLKEFKDSLKDTASSLYRIINEWIKFSNNEKSYYKVISGYQSLHMFISLFKILYDFDKDNYTIVKNVDKTLYKKVQKYLPLHLFNDIISDYWSINRQVSDLHENINNDQLLFKYQNNIPKEDIMFSLDKYIERTNSNNRKTIPPESKFILDFVHKINMQSSQSYREKFGRNKRFDFEHITPKQRVGNIIDMIPISSISNLCVMLERDNRSKQSLTLYEDESTRGSYELSEEILDLMIYPKKSELEFLDYSAEQKKDGFLIFIKNRKNTLSKIIGNKVTDFFNK